MPKPTEIDALLYRRHKRLPDYSYKLAGSQFGLDFVTATDDLPPPDESRMCCWVPYADGNRRDGVGDLLEVGGIDLSRHVANPIHLFDHGKQVALPIGMVQDPTSGQYTGVIDPVTKSARDLVFYYQSHANKGHAEFCEQLFDLWCKKYIRAGSIGYAVKQAQPLQADYGTGTPQGLHLLSVLKLESSTVVLPANGDTVRKMLALPRVCGRPLSPYLVKSLEPYCPPAPAQVVGGWKAQPSDAIDPDKARQILRDGTVHGKPLTEAQRGMFGAAAGRDTKAQHGGRGGGKVPNRYDPLTDPIKAGDTVTAREYLQNAQGRSVVKPGTRLKVVSDAGAELELETSDGVRVRAHRTQLRKRTTAGPDPKPAGDGPHATREGPKDSSGGASYLNNKPGRQPKGDQENYFARCDRDGRGHCKGVDMATGKAFCPTGEDGGVDNSCGGGEGSKKPGKGPSPKQTQEDTLRRMREYSYRDTGSDYKVGETLTYSGRDGEQEVEVLDAPRHRGTEVVVRVRTRTGPSLVPVGKLKRKAMRANTKALPDEVSKEDAAAEANAPPPGEEAYDFTKEKWGAQMARRFHQDHKLLMKDYEEMLDSLEEPDLQGHFGEYMKYVGGAMKGISKLFKKKYKDYPPLDEDEAGDADPEVDDRGADEEVGKVGAETDEGNGGDLDTMDDAAVGAGSDPDRAENEPSPEEVVAGMDAAREEDAANEFHKGKRLNGRPRKKGLCPECRASGQTACSCGGQVGQKIGPMAAATIGAVAGGLASRVGSDDKKGCGKGFAPHQLKALKAAAAFLKALGEDGSDLGGEGQFKSYHFHKQVDDTLEEAHDDLAQVPPETDVPPAEFEPGVGAKGTSGPTRMQIQRDYESLVASGKTEREATREVENRYGISGVVVNSSGQVAAWSGDAKYPGKAIPVGRDWVEEESPEAEHKALLRGVSKFFADLAREKAFGDPHREQAKHWAKKLQDLVGHQEGVQEMNLVGENEPLATGEAGPEVDPTRVKAHATNPGELGEKAYTVLFEQARADAKRLAELQTKLARLAS